VPEPARTYRSFQFNTNRLDLHFTPSARYRSPAHPQLLDVQDRYVLQRRHRVPGTQGGFFRELGFLVGDFSYCKAMLCFEAAQVGCSGVCASVHGKAVRRHPLCSPMRGLQWAW